MKCVFIETLSAATHYRFGSVDACIFGSTEAPISRPSRS
jgi:hypothetical protein